jgi:hypothetical protein
MRSPAGRSDDRGSKVWTFVVQSLLARPRVALHLHCIAHAVALSVGRVLEKSLLCAGNICKMSWLRVYGHTNNHALTLTSQVDLRNITRSSKGKASFNEAYMMV